MRGRWPASAGRHPSVPGEHHDDCQPTPDRPPRRSRRARAAGAVHARPCRGRQRPHARRLHAHRPHRKRARRPAASWDIDTYCARFKGQPAADEATRRRSIDAIDIGGTAASAKITLVHGAITFIDYFVLLKTEAGWKIANKAFHAQPH